MKNPVHNFRARAKVRILGIVRGPRSTSAFQKHRNSAYLQMYAASLYMDSYISKWERGVMRALSKGGKFKLKATERM